MFIYKTMFVLEREKKEVAMAPFFAFLLIGIFLGVATGVIKHEDWLGYFADVETSTLGALIGGMAFVFLSHQLENVVGGALLASLATAVVFLVIVKRIIDREPTHMHR
jgi:uncharacterized membrane protein YeaQ/YmgE (transglycosylase-associated protein family)